MKTTKQINLSDDKSIIDFIIDTVPHHTRDLNTHTFRHFGVENKCINFHFESSCTNNKGKQPTTTKNWLKKLKLTKLLPIQDRIIISHKSIPEADSFNIFIDVCIQKNIHHAN